AGDGEHRLVVELGVVNAVQQVDSARSRGREADAEPAGELGIGAGGESGRFLVSHLHEFDLVLPDPERLEHAVDTIPGNSEDRVHAPFDEGLDKDVAAGHRHLSKPPNCSGNAQRCEWLDEIETWRTSRCRRLTSFGALRELVDALWGALQPNGSPSDCLGWSG